ncbi:MAG: DUF3810 domain-containing protein [Capnocytophaga sp.]|nr:DUF3810 domain-containing protein [Capnocytophaga sp.]
MKVKRSFFTYFFLLLWLGIWVWFRASPMAAERYYSRGIYPPIATIQHFVWGWIPFSAGDVLYTVAAAFALYFAGRYFRSIWQHPLWFFGKIFRALAWVFVLFFSLWGFNYFRMPLGYDFPKKPPLTAEKLMAATDIIVQKSNDLHRELATSDSVKVNFHYTNDAVYKLAAACYPLDTSNLKTNNYRFPSVKPSLYSTALTYMGYSGYLNPFTNEAQVNGRMPGYATPHTACHEIAHQMGYAAENEANYIGFVAAYRSDDPYFRYSAALFALRQLLADVKRTDPEKYAVYIAQLNRGIFENYTEVRRFWQQYENKAEPVFKTAYDTFLKANKQSQGIQSYSMTTNLLVDYLLEEKEIYK